jgi:hypothetical protein
LKKRWRGRKRGEMGKRREREREKKRATNRKGRRDR